MSGGERWGEEREREKKEGGEGGGLLDSAEGGILRCIAGKREGGRYGRTIKRWQVPIYGDRSMASMSDGGRGKREREKNKGGEGGGLPHSTRVFVLRCAAGEETDILREEIRRGGGIPDMATNILHERRGGREREKKEGGGLPDPTKAAFFGAQQGSKGEGRYGRTMKGRRDTRSGDRSTASVSDGGGEREKNNGGEGGGLSHSTRAASFGVQQVQIQRGGGMPIDVLHEQIWRGGGIPIDVVHEWQGEERLASMSGDRHLCERRPSSL